MPYALIENGVVTQLYLPENPPEGYVPVPAFVQPGFAFDGQQWTAPTTAPIDPLTIPLDRLAFWLVAASAGVSKWSVRDRIAAMPETTPEEFQEKAATIAWFEEAPVYRRNDPILIAMAEAEGITPEQLDALWTYAVT